MRPATCSSVAGLFVVSAGRICSARLERLGLIPRQYIRQAFKAAINLWRFIWAVYVSGPAKLSSFLTLDRNQGPSTHKMTDFIESFFRRVQHRSTKAGHVLRARIPLGLPPPTQIPWSRPCSNPLCSMRSAPNCTGTISMPFRTRTAKL